MRSDFTFTDPAAAATALRKFTKGHKLYEPPFRRGPSSRRSGLHPPFNLDSGSKRD